MGKKLRKLVCPFFLKNIWNVSMGRKRHEAVFSTIDFVRNAQVEQCLIEVLTRRVQGDVAELGVYKGDMSVIIASILRSHFSDKTMFLLDTFSGFDKTDLKADIYSGFVKKKEDFTKTSEMFVMKRIFKVYKNALSFAGRFPDVLENENIKEWLETKYCFVSIDVDLAIPTYEGLSFFWPRISVGGYIFIHDYLNREYRGVREYVDMFMRENDIRSFMVLGDYCGTIVLKKV